VVAGAVTAFVSGITEPLEFSFLFVAPVLYAFHSVMAGLSFMLTHMLGVSIGGTGGGIIDFFIWGVLQPGSKWYMIIPLGVVYFCAYYFVFYKYLTAKHITIDAPDDSAEVANEAKVAERSHDAAAHLYRRRPGRCRQYRQHQQLHHAPACRCEGHVAHRRGHVEGSPAAWA
jgi:phosphotransferase system  glucose/maltose/N-acetylglucosamine-specific IIC component